MARSSQTVHYATNLRSACETRPSISELCRELGFNRQQFNRYIHDEAVPSPFNRARIAGAFGLKGEDFLLPPAQFARRLGRSRPSSREGDALTEGFPGDLDALRTYFGFYQTYHLSMSWPGRIVCSCAQLFERDGLAMVKTMERLDDPHHAIRQLAKYVGMAAWWRGRIFIVERSVERTSMIAQTTLTPFEVHQRSYLKGITMGVAWRRENLPYASRMIWRHMGPDADLRALVGRCGLYDPSHRQLPEPVLRFLDPHDPKIVSIPTSP